MFVPLVYTATVALLSLRSFVSAAPLVPRAGQGAWNPPITAPQAGDVWTVGSSQNVTWDTNKIPPSAEDNTGILLLGYYDESEGENLDIDNPLAYGFPLNEGIVCFDVPDVQTRDTYIVVLMGNSGNASPEFTIINPSSTSAVTYSSPSSSDKAIAQKGSNDLDPIDSSHLPPNFPATPVSPVTPEPPLSNPEIDPMETEPLSEDASAPAFCRERHPSTHSGSTPGQWRDLDLVSGEGPNKHC